MSDSLPDPDQAAAFIARCTLALAQQVQGGATWKIKLPEPTDDVEREALRLFLAEIEAAIGIQASRGTA